MNKTIELPNNVFDRLANHATGFDTPENVITRLLDFYENQPKKKTQFNLDEDIIKQAFRFNFDVEPRSFGQKTSPLSGYSDDNTGVQWNIVVNGDTGKISLGVNLEGIKYKDWPIANLLLKERKQAKLLDLTRLDNADKIQIKMSRDAWQAASRPPIKERHIAPTNLLLSDLTTKQWNGIIEESLGCLNKKLGYKGRGSQVVSRIKSGDTKQMDVSPHLGFRVTITDSEPQDIDAFLTSLKQAQNILLPLYDFVTEQTK
jgi:hypothetical protein